MKDKSFSNYVRWSFLAVFVVATVLIFSCSKTDKPLNQADQKKSQSLKGFTVYAPANKPTGFILYSKTGDSLVYHSGKLVNGSSNLRVYGCGVDPYFTPPVIYQGYTAVYNGCPSDPTSTVTLYFTIEAHTEFNLTPSSTTKGRVKLVGNGFAPTVTKTSVDPVAAAFLGSYINPYGEEVNKFSLTFNITLNATDFCNYNEIAVNTTNIPTDCEDYPLYAVSATTDYLTPNTYKVYPYSAIGETGQMTVFPLITTCENCHDPVLGSSPTNEVQYRMQGALTWTTVTYNDVLSHAITGLAPGTYEYRSRGQVDTVGNFSPYTSISTVVVH